MIEIELKIERGIGVELSRWDWGALWGKSERQLEEMWVEIGGDAVRLGDCARVCVDGDHDARMVLTGVDRRCHGVGLGWSCGELILEGDVGHRCGEGQSGGVIEVRGDVGESAGIGKSNGRLIVRGNAGGHLGGVCGGESIGMSGGEIFIEGDAGRFAGERMRRGLLVIGGNAGSGCGHQMLAGTVIVGGDCGMGCGTGNRRGTIIVGGELADENWEMRYRYACEVDPTWLRVYQRHIKTVMGERWGDEQRGAWGRYVGDVTGMSRGEILVRRN